MKTPVSMATLISGGGRTVLNLADEIDAGRLDARITVVIAHDESLAGVDRCRSRGLPVEIVPVEPRETLDERVDDALSNAGADLVCLCGYLRYFRVGTSWAGRTLNIHPSLLPDFGGRGMYGDRVHRAVLESGAPESGCTVHFVDEVYDHGPIILQRRCEVQSGDDAATLAARVFELEKEAFPEAIRMVVEGRIEHATPAPPAGGIEQ